jgi:hypothetical protein
MIDKLAEYVSRNGIEFEENIKKKNDKRFEFLNKDCQFNVYYRLKIKQLQENVIIWKTNNQLNVQFSGLFYQNVKINAEPEIVKKPLVKNKAFTSSASSESEDGQVDETTSSKTIETYESDPKPVKHKVVDRYRSDSNDSVESSNDAKGSSHKKHKSSRKKSSSDRSHRHRHRHKRHKETSRSSSKRKHRSRSRSRSRHRR